MLESPFVRQILTLCGFPSSPEPVAVRTAAVRKRHAEILAAYAAIADKYPHGIHQLIGRVLDMLPRYVRDVVNDAVGRLPSAAHPHRPGRAGGDLTDAARALFTDQERAHIEQRMRTAASRRTGKAT